jgi:hypothetical protein
LEQRNFREVYKENGEMNSSDYLKIERLISENDLLDDHEGWEDQLDDIIQNNYDEEGIQE